MNRVWVEKLCKGLPIKPHSSIIGAAEFEGYLIATTSEGAFIFHDNRWKSLDPNPTPKPNPRLDAYIAHRKATFGD